MKRLWAILLLTSCCSHPPAPPLQETLIPEPQNADIVHRIFAYGDTRTGVLFFESQENFGEGMHDWVVSQMLSRGGKRPANVVFSGDAVYSGGATFHWDNFLSVISKFEKEQIRFYPAVGNHELMAAIVGVISPWFDGAQTDEAKQDSVEKTSDPDEKEMKRFVLSRHRAGKDGSSLDEKSKALKETALENLEKKVYASDATVLKTHAQNVMNALYVKKAGMAYLGPIFAAASYYAVEIPGTPTILEVILDTNSLADPAQKAWFKKTLDNDTHDLVMVFGHHPPNTIAGWDFYLPYLNSHKKALIWIFSHVHSFEYSFPDTKVDGRGLYISGGGGAPLVEADEKSGKVEGWTKGPPNPDSGRFYNFLDIKVTRDAAYITVLGCLKKGEPMVPKAVYRVPLGK